MLPWSEKATLNMTTTRGTSAGQGTWFILKAAQVSLIWALQGSPPKEKDSSHIRMAREHWEC